MTTSLLRLSTRALDLAPGVAFPARVRSGRLPIPFRMSRRRSRRAEPSRQELVVKQARSRANRRLAFFGHLLVWGAVSSFLLVVGGFMVAVVVAMAWGVGLLCHGFFFVVAPELRARWVASEVERRLHRSVTHERRALEGRHARSLEQLSASVAHEIRNPITAAKSLVQQIAESPDAPDNAEFARVAAGELDRVERSVSHLLRFAREEPLDLGDVDVEEAVRSALALLNARLSRSPVSVKVDLGGDERVHGDAEKLGRVVQNLVGNAVDALEESGFPDPTVVVTSGRSLDGRDVWIAVEDNGPGIEPERVAKVFDPFHTSKASGTGLGLAISRKIVEAHGGTLEVESELGRGARFVATLPRLGPLADSPGG